ncbi:PREDICTED: protein MEI2-like 4 [Tarenaya hassleriana]|uniref:protein MEI2-like 4 n=1 Tax=Tarenaya hassleriana TaxID=28532 RepID=UPI00053CA3BC|nr:PREDICTED: protein MEI2-like 4 [Tarenaya hassleriana]XP_010555584.1 PREDICTED: protein MEI2-like 4 [Tarenaya hassleriana]
MPSQIMDQRGVSASTHYYEEIFSSAERHVGFWKPNSMPDSLGNGGMMSRNGSRFAGPVSHEQLTSDGVVDSLRLSPSTIVGERMEKPVSDEAGFPNLPRNSWNSMDLQPNTWSSLYFRSTTHGVKGDTDVRGIGSESSLFSSSLSELYSRKLRLSRNDLLPLEPGNQVASENQEVEPFESLEEIEAQTIGNLLPDEDDLFSGVIGEARNASHASGGDDFEDFDLFSSGGGLELEGDEQKSGRGLNGFHIGDHTQSKRSSRTLVVRNIDSSIEDFELKPLFEQFGGIQTFYTACKHHGFVMISYYDIRAAQSAMRSLQRNRFGRHNLDIHYAAQKENSSVEEINQATLAASNLDSSVSYDKLLQIFEVFGEVKEIYETGQKKFIEFYDIRSAEAALYSLNGTDLAGKQIKLVRGQQVDDLESLSLVHMATASPGIIASSFMDSGSTKTSHNLARSPMNSFAEPHQNFGASINLSSSARMMPFDKTNGVQVLHQSTNGLKFGNRAIPIIHPHSFPEYHEGFTNGSPCKASNTFMEMAGNGMKLNGGFKAGDTGATSSNGHHIRAIPSGFGSLGNGHVNNHIWNNNSQAWPHSPSGISGVHAHRFPPVAAFPRNPPMLVKVASPVHHHIGSAPTVKPTQWDRRHAYLAESAEASGFLHGSPSHPMDISSHNSFAHVAGNRMDMSPVNVGPRSPHLFSGRNSLISIPGSFDSPVEQGRNFSHRRSESSSNNADKKQFELDLDRILRGEDNRTTLMIKNIPNKYTSKMLLAAIDEHCKGTYDFIYLPIDFKNKCNVGYAFINMIDPQKIVPFHKAFDGKKWEKFNSEKVASLAYARIQGKAALIAHFQNSSLMNEDKRCRPILFHTDGPNAGDQEPFPLGANVRSRSGKSRTISYEESCSNGSSSLHSSSANNKPNPSHGDDSTVPKDS